MKHLLSRLPSVDRLLRHPRVASMEPGVARSVVVRAVREVLEEAREEIVGAAAKEPGGPGVTGRDAGAAAPSADRLAELAAARAIRLARPRLRRVVNATGIVVHTNLGRSLLSERATSALVAAARNYVTLEYDLDRGERASRQDVARELLVELTGAGDALVVNNNAAAVMVTLNSLAEGREVIISRGELVEIGGSFRLPDVMAKSGARMVEVGTTNRTRLADYAAAVSAETGALLKVHRSNFALRGFTAEASIEELAGLARARGIPLIHDLGSGALVDFGALGVARETMPRDSLEKGADVVTFSGDKLLGGPQAGIIAGDRAHLARIAANPLMRAMRVEKLILAALEATLAAYQDGIEAAVREIPTLSMIAASKESLDERAQALARRLVAALGDAASVAVIAGGSEAGGGALPGETIATSLVSVRPRGLSPGHVQAALRRGEPPVIAIIREDALLFDLRTVAAADEDALAAAIERAALGGTDLHGGINGGGGTA